MRTPWCAALLACCLALPGQTASAAATQSCQRQLVAQTTLRDDDGFITMPVSIGGHAASLLVDTGSDAGLLTGAGAARLGLTRRDAGARVLVHGTGGTGRTLPAVYYPDLRIGALAFGGGVMPVGPLPAMPVLAPPVVGLLGADLLSRFDVEFDLAHHRIAFWHVQFGSMACADPPPWPHGAGIALSRSGNRMSLSGSLDGQPITALVDTGARSRILSNRAAQRLGVDGDRLGADPGGITAGIDLHEAAYHWHRFRSLTIGDETQPAPVLTVAPLAEPVDLLLGADWFAARTVWISYATDQLFIRADPGHG